ncbi:MAG: hypothetical protein WB760_16230, partial [Xanthobacteraceae bacterium]
MRRRGARRLVTPIAVFTIATSDVRFSVESCHSQAPFERAAIRPKQAFRGAASVSLANSQKRSHDIATQPNSLGQSLLRELPVY